MPYGHASTNLFPDCQDNNQGYNIARDNPYFWGWAPFHNLIDQVLGATQSAGLQLGELDLTNEFDLLDFTVAWRLIYDNIRSYDVLSDLRNVASAHAFNPYLITFSTASYDPNAPAGDCGSVYGDSAMLILQSELTAAYAGGNSLIGLPNNTNGNYGLPCGGDTSGMISTPLVYYQPQIVDIHIYSCVAGSNGCDYGQDATSTAIQ